MKYSRGIYGIAYLLSISLLLGLAGCSAEEGESVYGTSEVSEPTAADLGRVGEDGSRLSMEEQAILEYEVPLQLPHFLVDPDGYSASEEKIAYLYGEDCPEICVLQKLDGEERMEYTLTFGKQRVREGELASAKVDFSEITQAGTYQFFCENWGYSEVFCVDESFYRNKLNGLKEQVTQQISGSQQNGLLPLYLLQAYEWNMDYFVRDVGDSAIPEPLEAVRDYLARQSFENGEHSDTAYMIGILAKFGYLYQNYDSKLATECVQKAFYLFDTYAETATQDSTDFWAMTELYRASGQAAVKERLDSYTNVSEAEWQDLSDVYFLFGGMTYLTTRQRVDKKACDRFVSMLLKRGEENSRLFAGEVYPKALDETAAGELMVEATILACANFILEGYQYNHQIAEIVHVLRGRNASCFQLPMEGEETENSYFLYSILANLEYKGMLNPGASVDW